MTQDERADYQYEPSRERPSGMPSSGLRPPLLADRLLAWCCAPHLLEEVQGDLHERFCRRVERFGIAYARRKYAVEVLGFLRPAFLKRRPQPFAKPLLSDMFRSYFTIALRTAARNKVSSFINIAGLSVGMACCMLLLLYVADELSYDRFHEKKGQLYQVWKHQKGEGGKVETGSNTPIPLAEALRRTVPEIRNVARTDGGWQQHLIRYGDKSLKKQGHYVDPAFLDMFTFPLKRGNRAAVLKETNSIVLTESLAGALFGKANPVGKVIRFDNEHDLLVTGVLQDVPINSTFQFDYLVPWRFWEQTAEFVRTGEWGNFSFHTYAELRPDASLEQADRKVRRIIKKNAPTLQFEAFLHPLPKWRLYSEFRDGVNVGGAIAYVRLFALIAFGVLLIACINFMNLSTARSERRAREVGIRKVVGAGRGRLTAQFLLESVLMAFVALAFAVLLVELVLPAFNDLLQKKISVDYGDRIYWLTALGVTLFTGVLAGSYPAFFLSSFHPVAVLKGRLQVGKAAVAPRKVLVVLQFAFSTVLIISTILIYRQIQYTKDRPSGYQKDHLLFVELEGDILKNLEPIRREALGSGAATSLCLSSQPIVWGGSSTWGVNWPGRLAGEEHTVFNQIVTTYDFTRTFGIRLKEGRDFSRQFGTDSNSVMLNGTAVKTMRLENPVGTVIKWQGKDRTVVGVIEDFVWGSPYEPVMPMIIGFDPEWAGILTFRLDGQKNTAHCVAALERIFKKHNSAYPFAYRFVDQEYEQKFAFEQTVGTLANGFAGIAIFVSCLGLFGLAAFTAERRTKEIGIRKVLGASLGQLWFTLTKDFFGLIAVAFGLAAPVAYFLMRSWLEKYAYHVPVSGWVFALTGGVLLLVALLTVGYQTARAALANPVDSLRSE